MADIQAVIVAVFTPFALFAGAFVLVVVLAFAVITALSISFEGR